MKGVSIAAEVAVLTDTIACHTDICDLINNGANKKKARRNHTKGHKDVIIELSVGCPKALVGVTKNLPGFYSHFYGRLSCCELQEISRFLGQNHVTRVGILVT